MPTNKRVIAYIDGFNLYYGLRESGFKKLYWLNVHSLAFNLLSLDCELIATKYFTARLKSNNNEAKRLRQQVFLETLGTIKGIEIIEGKYESRPYICPDCQVPQSCYKCKMPFIINSEKMTDVNIATEMVVDAATNKFDEALLISGDTDLKSAIVKTTTVFNKMVRIAFPPLRATKELGSIASSSLTIGKSRLRQNQLPPTIQKPGGFVLRCPVEWT